MLKKAIVVDSRDNVATVVTNINSGSTISMFINEYDVSITVFDDIPFGHKVAIKDIGYHETVVKYGESIGQAAQFIRKGDYVHVHNVERMRERDCWKE